MKKTVVLDFDGTLLDTSCVANTYYTLHREAVGKLLPLSKKEFLKRYAFFHKKLKSHPENYGWSVNGYIVAPSTADPYMIPLTVAQQVLYSIKDEALKHAGFSRKKLDETIGKIFYSIYPELEIPLQKGVRECVAQLGKKYECTIITNSETAVVKKELKKYGLDDLRISLLGWAKKYQIDDSLRVVPKSVRHKGFPRSVYLRRKKYYSLLKKIKNIYAVIGDIYEFDLALPEAMGMYTVLFQTPFTPSWELKHYTNHPNGFISDSLLEISEKLTR